jgi:hypothetical protein
MTCKRCQGWMLEERRMDFSPDTFVYRCIHCACVADPWLDQQALARAGKQLLVESVNLLH